MTSDAMDNDLVTAETEMEGSVNPKSKKSKKK